MPTKRTSLSPCEKIKKRDRHRHKSVFEDCHLPDEVDLAYNDGRMDFLHGCKMGSHIFCFCCFTKVSPSQFEFHAGFGSRRKPYTYIRVICTGVTLHDLATRLSGGGGEDVENHENHCNACNQGGDLLHCNRCLKFFHIECKMPHFERYCTRYKNVPSTSKSADRKINTQEATTDKRADPIKETGNQDVQGAESDIVQIGQTSCYLCRGIDFQNEPFGPSTMLLCDQCERECHVGCLKTHNLADLKELPKGHWFCTISCQNIHSSLHDLLKRGQQKLSQSAISTMRKKHMEESLDMTIDFDVSWQLLSGQISCKEAETNQLLTKAVYVLQKGFALLSCGSKHSLIRRMVHGENMDGQQFYGMHCAVLLVKSKIVSVAVFRLFGQELAEMPLITTRSDYRGKGYFHALFNIICGICRSHNVKSIVLPATEAAEGLWLKLRFKRMTEEQITAKREFFPHVVEFSDAVMLEKHLPQRQLSEVAETDPKAKTSIYSLVSDDCSVNLENRYSYIRGVSNRETLDNSANRLRGRGEDVQMHDNHCNTCNKGGDLLHCSRCLKSFHIECTSLTQKPHSEWLCTSCQNVSRRGRSVDRKVIAQVATIDEGVEVNGQEAKVDKRADPMKQTNNQDVHSVESDIIQLGQTSCYLCRGIDFQNEPFGPSTMLLCDQCDRESHVGCLKTHNLADLNELPKGHWFCTVSCQNIHFSLHDLLKSGTHKLSQSALSTMINKHMQQSLDFAIDFDASWRLLSGPISCKETETNQLLKKAISVLQKGFGLLSCGSRQSLIRRMVHGENMDGLQFYGMHCAVLLVKSKIVSAAVFRLFGQEVAELPLITTHPNYRGKGYFHALFDIIRGICESHNVKSIVLPATEAAQGLWFKLGFKRMTEEQIIANRELFPNIVEFSDVVMLEKQLPYRRLSDVAETVPEAYTSNDRLTSFG